MFPSGAFALLLLDAVWVLCVELGAAAAPRAVTCKVGDAMRTVQGTRGAAVCTFPGGSAMAPSTINAPPAFHSSAPSTAEELWTRLPLTAPVNAGWDGEGCHGGGGVDVSGRT